MSRCQLSVGGTVEKGDVPLGQVSSISGSCCGQHLDHPGWWSTGGHIDVLLLEPRQR